jgi:para-nitrobenzyl esterase
VTRREFVAGTAVTALSLCGRGLFAQGAAGTSNARETCLVKTPLGALRGEVTNGVRVFKGVPFAVPPTGALRFRTAGKMTPWTGERDATKFAPVAMQSGEKNFAQSEDCLFLNVWTPPAANGLPVFVWIHGGGLMGGDAISPVFDGSGFAREGVIIVTVAYRLGVLGFLEMEPLLGAEYAGSANNGLRDLIVALEWVQENIAAFGGDPARVTVGGESAGAKLTDVLMAVPQGQGLFAQMISESGGTDRAWPKEQSLAVASGFGSVWGAHPETLKTAPVVDLIAAQGKFVAGWPQHFPIRMEIDGALLPKSPLEMIASGTTRGKRLLIGTNRDESSMFIGPHPQHDAGAADLGNMSLAKFQEVFAKYKAVYPEMSAELLRIRAVTAEEYWVPSVRVADAHAANGSAWMYRLDFAPSSGRMKGLSYHSEDIDLVWDRKNKEAALTTQVHQAWLAFIKGGTPAAPGLPAWPKYSREQRETLVLDTVSRVENRPQEQELRLWDGLL